MSVAKAVLIGGVIIPVALHVLAPGSMPWWPDTASTAIAFGVAAAVVASRYRTNLDMNRRVWFALKALVRLLRH